MVGIVELIENKSEELGLRVGQTVIGSNGVTYKWAGQNWIIDNTNGKAGFRKGSIANREMFPSLTNIGREQNGKPPLSFDTRNKVIQPDADTTPRPVRPGQRYGDPTKIPDEDAITTREFRQQLNRADRRKFDKGQPVMWKGLLWDKDSVNAMDQKAKDFKRITTNRRKSVAPDDPNSTVSKSKKFLDKPTGLLGRILRVLGGAGVIGAIPAYGMLRQTIIQANNQFIERYRLIQDRDDISEEEKAEIFDLLEFGKEADQEKLFAYDLKDSEGNYILRTKDSEGGMVGVLGIQEQHKRIVVKSTVPVLAGLVGAVIQSGRALLIIANALRAALGAGTVGMLLTGWGAIGWLAMQALSFALINIGGYYAMRWLLTTEVGQKAVAGILTTAWIEALNGYLENHAQAINNIVENNGAPIMDAFQTATADSIDAIGDYLSKDIENATGSDAKSPEEISQLRQEWDDINDPNRNIPNTVSDEEGTTSPEDEEDPDNIDFKW